jgi:hypothetical protein
MAFRLPKGGDQPERPDSERRLKMQKDVTVPLGASSAESC